jgi:hypothetical protein
MYAKNRAYNRLELATRIFTPSYVSFETVLAQEGMVFQYYDKIFVASYLIREITVDQQTYFFRKIKSVVSLNNLGVQSVDETPVATKERACLDTLYVNADYHFDNIHSLDWERVFAILPIYQNQRMAKKVNHLYRNANEQTA